MPLPISSRAPYLIPGVSAIWFDLHPMPAVGIGFTVDVARPLTCKQGPGFGSATATLTPIVDFGFPAPPY